MYYRYAMAAQASPYTIQLSPDDTPGYTHAQGLTAESAELVSDLLNINHESYHTRWKQTFHSKTARQRDSMNT